MLLTDPLGESPNADTDHGVKTTKTANINFDQIESDSIFCIATLLEPANPRALDAHTQTLSGLRLA